MATINVFEYKMLGHGQGNRAQLAQEPPVTSQTVTYTTSTASSAFNADTTIILMQPTVDCYVAFGVSPTATTSTRKLIADQDYWIGVNPKEKVAVYDGTS